MAESPLIAYGRPSVQTLYLMMITPEVDQGNCGIGLSSIWIQQG